MFHNKKFRKLKYDGSVLLLISLTAAACGTSTATNSSSSTTVTTNTKSSPATSTTQTSTTVATSTVLSPSRLASLTNYSYTMEISSGSTSSTVNGKIYSPTNYEVALASAQTYVVNGQAYVVVANQSPQQVTLGQNFFQQQGIIAAANAVSRIANTSGVTVSADGKCSAAGVTGTKYTLSNASTQGNPAKTPTICIANNNGALLSLTQGTAPSSTQSGGNQTFSFEVTGIGNVSPIQLP